MKKEYYFNGNKYKVIEEKDDYYIVECELDSNSCYTVSTRMNILKDFYQDKDFLEAEFSHQVRMASDLIEMRKERDYYQNRLKEQWGHLPGFKL